MRITNKIMQNNSLSNINTNKILQDKLNTQMATHKKINRPSEDPVIAIRALRLRSSLSEITQYFEKNVPDAESWLGVTDSSLLTVDDLLKDMGDYCQQGSSDNWQATDRAKVLESLKGLKNEIYSTGDVDYAGRNVFTGYRTGTKLSFQADTHQKFTITEQLGRENIDKRTYVKDYNGDGSLTDLNGVNYNNGLTNTEVDVEKVDVYRIRLAYGDLDSMKKDPTDTAPDMVIEYNFRAKKDPVTGDVEKDPVTGETVVERDELTVTKECNSYDQPDDPYTNLGEDDVVYVKDTGELLLGKKAYEKLTACKDDPDTQDINEGEIRVTYEKSDWKKGDLNPVHYFACESEGINYNKDYLKNIRAKQEIAYDVGFNQTIRVNTTADEVYFHAIGRDIEEMIQAVEDVIEMEAVAEKMKELLKKDPDDKAAKDRLDAVNKALTFLNDKMRNVFTGGITKTQRYKDKVNQAIADCGTRGSRLDLIQSRLQSQHTTFDTLASDNENADLTKVTIELSSAELSYNAALMATGKVIQSSLLNFL